MRVIKTTVNAKAYTSMTPAEKKLAASMKRKVQAKPKVKDLPVVFEEGSSIYFCKKTMSNARCHICREHFKEGDAYRVSKCSRAFKHVECQVEQVK